ncbi:hypothetical protein niasHS_001112 [Heterodera schachtii]|uniref:TIL domain-containing protein n=1 Tax=Heterodera schachtii TaxID=97005 RepID=A0ABD2KCC1_HETSC
MTVIKLLMAYFLFIFFNLANAQNEQLNSSTAEPKDDNNVSTNSSSTTSLPFLFGCPPGEELRLCSFCDGTCRFPVPFCGFFCSFIPRCFCQLDRLRNARGQCIPRDQCFSRQTPAESYCCGNGRCLHCAVGYHCVVLQSRRPYCRPHWYGIGLMDYDDDDDIDYQNGP